MLIGRQRRQRTAVPCLLILALAIITNLTACGSTQNPTPLVDPKTTTVSDTPISQSVVATNTPQIVAAAALAKLPLNLEVSKADKIFLGEVVKIGDLVWDTPDGKAPSDFLDPKYRATPQQLAPVEINIITVYKGNLPPSQKITIFLGGAPGAQPYGTWSQFPKLGDKRLWFVDKDFDFRRGMSATPLTSPLIQQLYTLQTDGKWVAENGNTLTITDLEQAIKNPAPTPQRPNVSAPTPTLKVKPGQTINLVQFYGLDKAQSVLIPIGERIKDTTRIQSIVAILNKPLMAMENPTQTQDVKPGEITSVIFIFPDEKTVSFEYNLKAGNLTHVGDRIRVPAPPELRKAVGLN